MRDKQPTIHFEDDDEVDVGDEDISDIDIDEEDEEGKIDGTLFNLKDDDLRVGFVFVFLQQILIAALLQSPHCCLQKIPLVVR